MVDRRQQIIDWLRNDENPKTKELLRSLAHMNLNDWETKHRRELRQLPGWSDLESNTTPLRDRVRGEFDTYVDNPVWYVRGKAKKLGVAEEDLKKALAELQQEKEYFEGRERRKKQVEEDFKWNFASDWAKQRYIDIPEKSYWNNPELSFEHIPDIADAAAGFAAGISDIALPKGIGTFAGPTIRGVRNIIQGQDAKDVMTNYGADLGANAGVDYLPTYIINKARKVAKQGATQVEQYADYMNQIDNSEKAIADMDKAFKKIDMDKINKLDSKEISKFRAYVDNLPDSPAKTDIKKILDQDPNEFLKETGGKLSEDLQGLGFNGDIALNTGRIKGYVESSKPLFEQNKLVKDVHFNPYNEKGQLIKTNRELIDTFNKKRTLGQGMSKLARTGANIYKPGLKLAEGGVKTKDTYEGMRQPAKTDSSRAEIEWYKKNYDRDWKLGFEPKGRDDAPIMKAYKEWKQENSAPSISDVF